MASTDKGRELTEEHRQDQVRLADGLVAALIKLFEQLVSFQDIDASALEFAKQATPLVLQARYASELFSRDYLAAFDRVENPDHDPKLLSDLPADDIDAVEVADQLATAVRASMKGAVKRRADEDSVLEAGKAAASGKGRKIAADGGRGVLKQWVDKGLGPVGYARVVDADPCPFCAMLASRGVSYTGLLPDGAGLYRSDAFKSSDSRFTGDGKFKVHDNCDCTLEPVYKVDGKITLPGNGDELAKEWAEVASGQPDALAAWRRWRVSGTLPEDYDGPLHGTRRKAPARGQGSGRKKDVKPEKRSEKLDKPSRWNKPISEATAEDFYSYAEEIEDRMRRTEEEIAGLRALGQTEKDFSLFALEQRRKKMLSQIERYKKAGDKLVSDRPGAD